MKLQQHHHGFVAEVMRSPVPVASIVALLGAFQLGVSLVALGTAGVTSLGVLVPSWFAWGFVVVLASWHVKRVDLTLTPEYALLDLTYTFGRKLQHRIALAELVDSQPQTGLLNWWLRLDLLGEPSLYVPCSTRADARRLSESLESARVQAGSPSAPAPAPEALHKLRERVPS